MTENLELVNEVINNAPQGNFKKKKMISKTDRAVTEEDALTEKNEGSSTRLKKNHSSSTTKIKKGSSVKQKKKKLKTTKSKNKFEKTGSINKTLSEGKQIQSYELRNLFKERESLFEY